MIDINVPADVPPVPMDTIPGGETFRNPDGAVWIVVSNPPAGSMVLVNLATGEQYVTTSDDATPKVPTGALNLTRNPIP